MKTLKEYKKYMLDYARNYADLEDGESPEDWVDAMMDALKEDGSIVTIKGREYVKD